jgi:hypothetical protein
MVARSTATEAPAVAAEEPSTPAVESTTLDVVLSTDGKHTILLKGVSIQEVLANTTVEEGQDTILPDDVQVAMAVYDAILAKYGPKTYTRSSGPAPRGGASRPSSSEDEGEDEDAPHCADCGVEIKGFKAQDGKFVSAAVIARSRKNKLGRVLCGKDGCRNEGGSKKRPWD